MKSGRDTIVNDQLHGVSTGYMITVYAIPISLYCAKLRILLRHKALEWQELPPPGGYGSDEYKTIIPSGNLPAMIDGDLTLADSEVIAEYLNEKYPSPPMLPEDINKRALARERSRFHDTRLEPELRKLFPYIDDTSPDSSLIQQQSVQITARLKQLSLLLLHSDSSAPNTLTPNSLTLGDCGLPITFTWIEILTPVFDLSIQWPQAVVQYRNEIQSHPAVAEELAVYKPALMQWLDSLEK